MVKTRGEFKKRQKERWQAFLHSFFKKHNCYQFKEVNGFVLEMRLTSSKNWEVAVFTKQSWKKTKEYLKNREVLLYKLDDKRT